MGGLKKWGDASIWIIPESVCVGEGGGSNMFSLCYYVDYNLDLLFHSAGMNYLFSHYYGVLTPLNKWWKNR
jgi:hypothetical protein